MSNLKLECSFKHTHAKFNKETNKQEPFFFRLQAKIENLQVIEGKGAGMLKGVTVMHEGSEDYEKVQSESVKLAKKYLADLPDLTSIETKAVTNIDEDVDVINGTRKLNEITVEVEVVKYQKFGDNVGIVGSAKMSAQGSTLFEAQDKAIKLAKSELGL